MSTKEPIQSASCPEACETGWRSVLCKAKALVCRLQKYIDPLCETDDQVLSMEEIIAVRKFVDEHVNPPGGMMTPRYPDYALELREVLNKYDAARTAASTPLRPFAKGRLTLLNRIGMLPAYGTQCPCCLGFRIWTAGVVGVLVGSIFL